MRSSRKIGVVEKFTSQIFTAVEQFDRLDGMLSCKNMIPLDNKPSLFVLYDSPKFQRSITLYFSIKCSPIKSVNKALFLSQKMIFETEKTCLYCFAFGDDEWRHYIDRSFDIYIQNQVLMYSNLQLRCIQTTHPLYLQNAAKMFEQKLYFSVYMTLIADFLKIFLFRSFNLVHSVVCHYCWPTTLS